MRETLAASKNLTSRPATGVGGGMSLGTVTAIFFGGAVGPILGIPKYLDRPEEMTALIIGVFYGTVLGAIFGFCLGAVLGFVNKCTNEAIRPGILAASIFGLILGLIAAAILMWHRVDVDQKLHHNNTSADYVVLSVILVVLLSTMGVILAVSLGWSIGVAIRSPSGFPLRVLNGAGVGAVSGCVSEFAVLALGYCILRPLISGYGGW